MVYYVPLLMINGFDKKTIEEFDKLLRGLSKSKNKKLTPKSIANILNISELNAVKLLAKSEEVGLVTLVYSIKCKNYGKNIKLTKMNYMSFKIKCLSDTLIEKIEELRKINFYYLSLV